MMALLFSQCAKQEMALGSDALMSLTPDRRSQMKQLMALAGSKGQDRATLRSSNTYTISEALDLLDETLNYAYCRPATPQRNTLILSDTLLMPVSTSSTVSEEDLADLFDAASLDIGTQYHGLTLNNKQPWVFSVNQFGEPANGEIPVIVQLEVAYGAFITDSIAYSSSVDYSYAWQGGLCNETPGPGAPEVLRDNLKYAYVPNPPNTKKYFKSAYYFIVYNVVHGDVPWYAANGLPDNIFQFNAGIANPMEKASIGLWDNINDFKLFRQCECVEDNYDECLSGDVEMPFNENEMGAILQAYLPALDFVPANIWVGSNKVDDLALSGYIVFHNMVANYSKTILVSSNDEPVELPCLDCN